jgi:hypothetical protein
MNEKSFAGLLQGEDRRTLPTEPSITIFPTGVGNHVKRNLAHLVDPSVRTGWVGWRGKHRYVPHAQRGACAGASPYSSDTSGFREGRPCPVCTAVFLRARRDLTQSFGLITKKEWHPCVNVHGPAPRPGSPKSADGKGEILHTLTGWPCARGTTTAITTITVVVVVTVIVAVITATRSVRGFSSARGFTRRLRLSDPGALRRGRRRVLRLDDGWLFALLFSLDCLSHADRTKCFKRESGWKGGRRRGA